MGIWLNDINVRVVFYENKGWAVERLVIKKRLFTTKKKWVNLVTYAGSEKPFYYQRKETAVEQTVKHFEWDVLINSQ